MTEKLPTIQQFNIAASHLHVAQERAACHFAIASIQPTSTSYGILAIESLKVAAEALGYELVQRVPTQAGSFATERAEANGGGRMDLPEVTGVAAVADA